MRRLVVAIFLLASAGAASAQPRQSEQEPAGENSAQQTEQAEPKNERRICRRVNDAIVGSTIPQRRCLTAEQWRALRRR